MMPMADLRQADIPHIGSLEFQNRKLRVHARGADTDQAGIPVILVQEPSFAANDSLLLQDGAFLRAIRSGEDGRNALRTAAHINRQLRDNPHRTMA